MDRKQFLKTTCLTGACICGFSSLAFSGEVPNPLNNNETALMLQEWITLILSGIDQASIEPEKAKTILKQCAVAHYKNLKMDEMLIGYKGDLDKFIELLRTQWNWIVDYNKETGVIISDENKNVCVCPMVNLLKDFNSHSLCYCSEGFGEMMFSAVIGSPVKAEVISSIKRGDKSCRYKLTIEK